MSVEHDLQLYNSLSRRKERFVPITPGQVRMYVCGMTVYDYCHVGHARVMVVFDAIVRYLRWLGYDVTYVRNITDIDDKIIRRAQENGETIDALTARFIEAMHEDADALGVLRPDHEPKATETIDGIIAMVGTLVGKDYAYVAANGDVYYRVARFGTYGRLANKKLDDLRAGERVAVGELKQDPLDFVLWKAAKPGEPAWDSPWGPGRPGWHIECSAMSKCCLGEHFDIHGGGMDLKFPHHENEIAQSEAANGHRFVNYWLHNGFVNVDEEKMSKSLGNFFTVREVLARYAPEVVRLFILSSHYRSPLNYSDDNLDTAKASLTRLYTALKGLPPTAAAPLEAWSARLRAVMDDDFNTPGALAVLFELARELNRARSEAPADVDALAATLRALGGVLGLLGGDADDFLKGYLTFQISTRTEDVKTSIEFFVGLSVDEIERLIAERTAARKAKQWAESDRIRDLLAAQGVVLEDGPQGTSWRRA
ncbi:cysteine--tRNA ligase [Plasticicumulans sp.]|uniref:cysteine--tRNA ligase n=1 Tax=Plasticicumulans sp. TaxID=2307179 RepID=UPI002BE50766|nr:cysteine--tRNA ligase [Plasticicumulans sp.]HNM43330.1 cysteine--tRNA ligase [Plasticicumulans sp.]